MREYNGKMIELLAPVGAYRFFDEIIDSKCDAIFCGGKKFNMRLHRHDFNLTDDELERAAYITHEKGKQIYVTFNKMLNDEELKESEPFLRHLERIGIDALIIADLGAVDFINKSGINLPMHLSIMGNAHSLEMVNALRKQNISRVVYAKDAKLQDITEIAKLTDMEFEYFVHGDTCSIPGGQCYASSTIFGNKFAGNRGACLKMCRWQYSSANDDTVKPYLSSKDLSLFQHIPQLVESGVNSYKIEGRMRDANFLVNIINRYGNAIDRYIQDPVGYYMDKEDNQFLMDNRVRNFTTYNALKKAGIEMYELDHEREPKIFSVATEEKEITEDLTDNIKSQLDNNNQQLTTPKLSVKVDNMQALEQAYINGADIVHLYTEVFRPNLPLSLSDLQTAVSIRDKYQGELYLALPLEMSDVQYIQYAPTIQAIQQYGFDGIMVHNIGQLNYYKDLGLKIVTEFNFNVYNDSNKNLLKTCGANTVTPAIECNPSTLKHFLDNSNDDIEVIVQGSHTVMYLNQCMSANINNQTSDEYCNQYCNDIKSLIDTDGVPHNYYLDYNCKTHIQSQKNLCLAPILNSIMQYNVHAIRIMGTTYTPNQVGEVTRLYRNMLDTKSIPHDIVDTLTAITNTSQSYQALSFNAS